MNNKQKQHNDHLEQFRCPRCQGYIPNNVDIGAYCGAISRLDNTTEICSACGQDEALDDYFLGGVVDWRTQDLDNTEKVN